MGWFRRNERKKEVPTTGVCDVCGAALVRAESYYVRTKDVGLSEAYWRKHFDTVRQMMDAFQMTDKQRLATFGNAVAKVAEDRTPWCICESCSELVIIDRDKARSCAVSDTAPEGTGPVDPAGILQYAAAAWEHVIGRWPASVQQPSIKDSCDLCAKKLYASEITGRLRKDQVEQYHATGIIDHVPLSPPRDGDIWLACAVCLSRALARLHRYEAK